MEKKGKPKWSNNIYTVVEKSTHSYLLSNNKWYRYYQLLLANESQEIKKIGRPAKQTFQSLKRANTIKRRLKHEDVNLKNIVNTTRRRQKTDRFTF